MQRFRAGLGALLRLAHSGAASAALQALPSLAARPALAPSPAAAACLWRPLSTSPWVLQAEKQAETAGQEGAKQLTGLQAMKRALRPQNSGRNAFRRAWKKRLQIAVRAAPALARQHCKRALCLQTGWLAASPPTALTVPRPRAPRHRSATPGSASATMRRRCSGGCTSSWRASSGGRR